MAKDSQKKSELDKTKKETNNDTPKEMSREEGKTTAVSDGEGHMSTPLLVGIVVALLILCGVGVWLLLRDAAMSSEPPILPSQPDEVSGASESPTAPPESDQAAPSGPTVAERQEQLDELSNRRNPHNLTVAERREQINNLGN